MRQTTKRNAKTPIEPAPPNVEPRPSEAELRWSILWKLAQILEHWRTCREPACRRHRRCATRSLVCLDRNRDARPMSPEKQAAALADLKRQLRQRLDELGVPR
jgi:hypothetical protein